MNRLLQPFLRSVRMPQPVFQQAVMMRSFTSSRPLFAPETIKITFIDAEGDKVDVNAPIGQTLLDIAHDNDIEIEGACGGELACSTCHCIFSKEIYDQLPEVSEEEEDMLDLAWGLTDTSRLGCQIVATKELDGMVVTVPDESNNLM